ncbi:hypothetical protein [Aureimonas altamirensis]|uniref:hypothetical protein n=1 Tax=Aureimonas altamirensis TaxID=370622 RepID=UPI003019B780
MDFPKPQSKYREVKHPTLKSTEFCKILRDAGIYEYRNYQGKPYNYATEEYEAKGHFRNTFGGGGATKYPAILIQTLAGAKIIDKAIADAMANKGKARIDVEAPDEAGEFIPFIDACVALGIEEDDFLAELKKMGLLTTSPLRIDTTCGFLKIKKFQVLHRSRQVIYVKTDSQILRDLKTR